ncbi:hypothetical protein AVEN_222680-1 [Araneus ventricosus]|uniref:MADF domain-containing protein n=1 Tax=Araneus ventricosus TaxID=182803 RepID=A0A4Y2B023_ARAVE|nr:hypothetical protein AVEN_222680-1 [Araneus ventricosus]
MSAKEIISIDDDISIEVPIDKVNDIIQRHMNNESSDDDESFIQTRFGSLRSYFQKEERKEKANSGAAGFDFVPKWVYYQHLLFLKGCSMVAPSESTLGISIVEDEPQAKLTVSTIRII